MLVREHLPVDFRQTLTSVCEPLAARIVAKRHARRSCLTVGLCGAQGSGKSTIAFFLKILLEAHGLNVAVLSIDDFYLTRAQRNVLAARVHPLLATRGVPGTHDIELALAVLQSLCNVGTTAIPVFDKSRDDRRPWADWSMFAGPAQVIILEGWCVGAAPQDEDDLVEPVNALEQTLDVDGSWRRYVNTVLAGDYQRLFAALDWLVMLAAPGFEVVHGWRLEQEQRLQQRFMAEAGDASQSMSAAQVQDFVAHYERLTRHMLAEMPGRADALVRLDGERRPLALSLND
jgi:D-glycerate 3-kinase